MKKCIISYMVRQPLSSHLTWYLLASICFQLVCLFFTPSFALQKFSTKKVPTACSERTCLFHPSAEQCCFSELHFVSSFHLFFMVKLFAFDVILPQLCESVGLRSLITSHFCTLLYSNLNLKWNPTLTNLCISFKCLTEYFFLNILPCFLII